jgi:hypothetical protein
MDKEKDNSEDQHGSGSEDSHETTSNTNAGENLPDRDPQILEKGHQPHDLEKRDK